MPVSLAGRPVADLSQETFLVAEKSVGPGDRLAEAPRGRDFSARGFILQKVTGPGTVFLDLSGEVVERDLAAR